jgi:hypothetical protein
MLRSEKFDDDDDDDGDDDNNNNIDRTLGCLFRSKMKKMLLFRYQNVYS